MKKWILFVWLIGFYFSGQAQNRVVERNNVLKISPVEFARSEFKLSYERYFLNHRHSVMLTPTLIYREEPDDKRLGLRFQFQYRYYLSHLNAENGNELIGLPNVGIYSAVYGGVLAYNDEYEMFLYNQETGTQDLYEVKRNIIAEEMGAAIGVQVDITKRFVMDFFIGGGVRVSQIDQNIDDSDMYPSDNRGGIFPYDYKGVKPTFGFMFGLLF